MPVDGENVNSVVTYKTQQEWLDYIQNGYGDGSGGCYVLNCGPGDGAWAAPADELRR